MRKIHKKHIYEIAVNTKTYYKFVEENPLKHDVGNHNPIQAKHHNLLPYGTCFSASL
jgi:hypothetical protein